MPAILPLYIRDYSVSIGNIEFKINRFDSSIEFHGVVLIKFKVYFEI